MTHTHVRRAPFLLSSRLCEGEIRSLGDPLLDRYVEFVSARARPNTVRATVSDLRAFFAVVDKAPPEVKTTDVFDFIAEQRRPRPGRGNVVRLGVHDADVVPEQTVEGGHR